jgi:SAM-dependent methyltransferase
MIKSQTIQYKDFSSDWYEKWSILLKQQKGITPTQKFHNKAWQNAIILQTLSERGYLKEGNRALGFGVGKERVPSALAALGLKVTATDQDFTSGKKGGWDNGQLTHTRNDLNQYGIANKKTFDQDVEFENCDMTKISKRFNNKYDIVWSNCALGHLGSIDAGLKFIEKSLDCLKPGGIAVHTTETNVVSNTDTIESGGTVIFRRKDLVDLFFKLRNRGYQCAPLHLDFGSAPEDKSFGFDPYETEVLLKLNAGGYLLSQMVLVIRKPHTLRPGRTAALRKKTEETLNSQRMKTFLIRNPELQEYIKRQQSITTSGVKPKQRVTRLKLKANQTDLARLQFKNTSSTSYYDIEKMFHDGNPLMVATSDPVNRSSKLATKAWLSPSRPNPKLTQTKKTPVWGGIKPGSTFWADLSLKAPSKPGKYVEEFCFTLEGLPVIPNSQFTIELDVRK